MVRIVNSCQPPRPTGRKPGNPARLAAVLSRASSRGRCQIRLGCLKASCRPVTLSRRTHFRLLTSGTRSGRTPPTRPRSPSTALNAKLLEEGARRSSAHGLAGHYAYLLESVSGRFDIWADRGINVIRSKGSIRNYERWLLDYANAWIQLMGAEIAKERAAGRSDAPGDQFLAELKSRLTARFEHWRAEVRKWVAEWEDYIRKVQPATATADPPDILDVKDGSPSVAQKSALARNIERFRQECGWTVDALAEKVRVDRTSVLDHLNKGVRPRPGLLKAYADAFSDALGRTITIADLDR